MLIFLRKVVFSLANVAQAALYIIGVSEFVSDLLREQGYAYVTHNRHDDIRLFSLAVCVIIMWLFVENSQKQ